MKILLVDDHPAFREGMKHLLRGLDKSVAMDEAESCADALGRMGPSASGATYKEDATTPEYKGHMPAFEKHLAAGDLAALWAYVGWLRSAEARPDSAAVTSF